jgi:predicted nucleic acid-binding protein
MGAGQMDHDSLVEALCLYESRPDKRWSLVDCASMIICQRMKIGRVFTHDHHFRQAGFEILL